MNNEEKAFLKWVLEVCSQEGYKTPLEFVREYNVSRGC
jgi:hypothetical protein